MTNQFPSPAGSAAKPDWHPGEDLLAGYVGGNQDRVVEWSVEAHLTACARCRSALSKHVDAERLAYNRSVLLVRGALPGGGWVRRLLCRCGLPDHVLRLLAATPSLRGSWLLSIAGVLAVVTGEAAAAASGWIGNVRPMGPAGHLDPEVLAPFLLMAPLLVLAGVAAAFLPMFDPAVRLAVAAPFSGFTLLLIRTVSALAAALVPVVVAAVLLPGPGWLPIALLLPMLALCSFALAAATLMEARAAALAAGALWALPAVLLAADHAPLAIVQWNGQTACAVVLGASAVVLLARRDRFETGWMA
jgi:hypothetical protein